MIGGSRAAAAQSAAPAPGTSAARDWQSAIDYYNAAQAAKGRMAQHAVGTWQYDSAKKNYDYNIKQYIAFAARAGATVTANTHPSQVFSGQSSGGSTQTTSNSSQQPSGSASSGASTPSVANGSRVNVSSGSALASALGNARCGQAITLANGSYSGSFNIDVNCKTSNPLIIQATSPLRAVISSPLTINGRSVHVRGIHFRGPHVKLNIRGNDHKLLGNKIEGWATYMAVHLQRGQNAEVAYNEFTRPDPFRVGPLGKYPLRIGIRSSHLPSDFHYNAHVHHNYFHDFPNKPNPRVYNSGQVDAIELCFTGTMTRSNWTIEYNLFDRHQQGHAIVDIKCAGGTMVRYNTIINSPNARIDFRNGNGGKMIANWIENAGGLGINGDNHEIISNVLTGKDFPEIILATGNVSSNGTYENHQSANNNTVTCNRGLHTIGKYKMSQPARNNTINSADGRIELQRHSNTRITKNGNCGSLAKARRLSVSEVGPQGFARSGR